MSGPAIACWKSANARSVKAELGKYSRLSLKYAVPSSGLAGLLAVFYSIPMVKLDIFRDYFQIMSVVFGAAFSTVTESK